MTELGGSVSAIFASLTAHDLPGALSVTDADDGDAPRPPPILRGVTPPSQTMTQLPGALPSLHRSPIVPEDGGRLSPRPTSPSNWCSAGSGNANYPSESFFRELHEKHEQHFQVLLRRHEVSIVQEVLNGVARHLEDGRGPDAVSSWKGRQSSQLDMLGPQRKMSIDSVARKPSIVKMRLRSTNDQGSLHAIPPSPMASKHSTPRSSLIINKSTPIITNRRPSASSIGSEIFDGALSSSNVFSSSTSNALVSDTLALNSELERMLGPEPDSISQLEPFVRTESGSSRNSGERSPSKLSGLSGSPEEDLAPAASASLVPAGSLTTTLEGIAAVGPVSAPVDSGTFKEKKPKSVMFDADIPEEKMRDERQVSGGSDDNTSNASDQPRTEDDGTGSSTRRPSLWNIKGAAPDARSKERALLRSSFCLGSHTGLLTDVSFKEFRQSPLAHLKSWTGNRHFEILVCAVIMINALIIGVTADYGMKNPGEDPAELIIFRIFEIFFLVFFTIELILRIFTEGPRFLSLFNNSFRWNVFDSTLVIIGVAEEMISIMLGGDGTNLEAFRVLRMLRVMRVFRVIRVFRFFKELRVMISGILNSLHSLMWALILLGCIKYVFAMVILQFAALEHETKTEDPDDGVLSEKDYADLVLFYGSLFETIFTLFQSISGGIDWGDCVKPLLGLHVGLGVCFALYIAFAVLCVLNIVTGVFVENAKHLTEEDQDMVLMEQLESREKWFDEVKDIFETADKDGSGYVNGEEFTQQIKQDARLQAQFRKIGVHVEAYSASGLFQLLDFDGDGELDLDEFWLALQQVHGNARSIDVAKLQHDCRILRRGMQELTEMCVEYFAELSIKIQNVGGIQYGQVTSPYGSMRDSVGSTSGRRDQGSAKIDK